MGMSENSDALIVVVSEETGAISVAKNGELKRGLTIGGLGNYLNDFLVPEDDEKKNRTFIRRKK